MHVCAHGAKGMVTHKGGPVHADVAHPSFAPQRCYFAKVPVRTAHAHTQIITWPLSEVEPDETENPDFWWRNKGVDTEADEKNKP